MASAAPERLRDALRTRSIALDRELGRGGMSVVYLAQDGTLLAAVGPVGVPKARVEAAADSLSRDVVAAVERRVRPHG